MSKRAAESTRAAQLRDAKRRQRARQRKAGLVHVQLTVPGTIAEKIAIARRSGDFERSLEEALDRCLIRISDYPQLADIAWNRHDALISSREAFQLYERNWGFVNEAELQPHERDLIARLTQEFGSGLLNA